MPMFVAALGAITVVCAFSFLSIAVFAVSRRKEREAFYRNEWMRRIAETPGGAATSVLEIMREEQRLKQHNSRERMKISGLINIAVGLGLVIFLYSLDGKDAPYLVGLLPGFIGIAMLVYVLFLTPKEE